ncbi:dATP/dGTP diphosphohydrolase domain-containing protein [Rhodopseudomonas sp. B29]|uniref:dATP/dGTP diphosphohydrolase domain-containing protein n=1 Tax=Rhodopseudomonas sp. B29 TaxID=95607 RepID=UPI0011D1D79D|nr:dATP/dGTP diphosphohydrolase domain-containing protein [Rhodopseudomonas sp. B29]
MATFCPLADLAVSPASPGAPAAAKASNPKDAFGTLKACLSWIPMEVIFELALAFAEGGFKYGGHNYLVAEPRASVYVDACARHVFQFWNLGEETDAESGAGLHHISKAIASLAVLRAAQIHGRYIDDRPPPAPAGFLADLNEKMKRLGETHADPVARYLAGGLRGPGRILPD